MKKTFLKHLEYLMERHLPMPYLDYAVIQKLLCLIEEKKNIERKEVLFLAYMIGANSRESDQLLEQAGHPILYVRKREDAIWRFMLDKHIDGASILKMMFPQKVDEKNALPRYNENAAREESKSHLAVSNESNNK